MVSVVKGLEGSGLWACYEIYDFECCFLPVVKQRMQMCCSPYSSCTQTAYSIFRAEGARAFYRSYGTQLTMNIPFQVRI